MFDRINSLAELYSLNMDIFTHIFSLLRNNELEALANTSKANNSMVRDSLYKRTTSNISLHLKQDIGLQNLLTKEDINNAPSATRILPPTTHIKFTNHLLNLYPSKRQKFDFLEMIFTPEIYAITNTTFVALALAKIILDLGYDKDIKQPLLVNDQNIKIFQDLINCIFSFMKRTDLVRMDYISKHFKTLDYYQAISYLSSEHQHKNNETFRQNEWVFSFVIKNLICKHITLTDTKSLSSIQPGDRNFENYRATTIPSLPLSDAAEKHIATFQNESRSSAHTMISSSPTLSELLGNNPHKKLQENWLLDRRTTKRVFVLSTQLDLKTVNAYRKLLSIGTTPFADCTLKMELVIRVTDIIGSTYGSFTIVDLITNNVLSAYLEPQAEVMKIDKIIALLAEMSVLLRKSNVQMDNAQRLLLVCQILNKRIRTKNQLKNKIDEIEIYSASNEFSFYQNLLPTLNGGSNHSNFMSEAGHLAFRYTSIWNYLRESILRDNMNYDSATNLIKIINVLNHDQLIALSKSDLVTIMRIASAQNFSAANLHDYQSLVSNAGSGWLSKNINSLLVNSRIDDLLIQIVANSDQARKRFASLTTGSIDSLRTSRLRDGYGYYIGQTSELHLALIIPESAYQACLHDDNAMEMSDSKSILKIQPLYEFFLKSYLTIPEYNRPSMRYLIDFMNMYETDYSSDNNSDYSSSLSNLMDAYIGIIPSAINPQQTNDYNEVFRLILRHCDSGIANSITEKLYHRVKHQLHPGYAMGHSLDSSDEYESTDSIIMKAKVELTKLNAKKRKHEDETETAVKVQRVNEATSSPASSLALLFAPRPATTANNNNTTSYAVFKH